jgi:nicotinate-nucleotide adenylyltransferase
MCPNVPIVVKKTGLFFGSFNPIHLGHLMIASWMAEFTDIDQVWFVISPHNPLKEKSSLLPDVNRLYMVNVAVEDEPKFKASNIEFHRPQPSYTVDTLTCISEKHPGKEFVVIAGSDALPTLHRWKNYDQLLEHYHFYIYPRPGTAKSTFDDHPHIHFVTAPLVEISSSFIRESIKEGKSMQYFLPAKVWEYIDRMGFYR